MKKLLMVLIVVILALNVVSATTTTLSDDDITMDYYDFQQVEFCLYEANGAPLDVVIVVDPVCKDTDGNYGCQLADESAAGLFSVVPNKPRTYADGCVFLNITTTISNPEDAGKFFYTVNGRVAGSTVGSETGTVSVPEFGIIAALGILTIAGIYIYRKRD